MHRYSREGGVKIQATYGGFKGQDTTRDVRESVERDVFLDWFTGSAVSSIS